MKPRPNKALALFTLALTIFFAFALYAASGHARLGVTHLSSFGAKPAAAAGGGGAAVVYQAAAAYTDDIEEVGTAPFENSFRATHSKDADTTFLIVAISMPGQNDNTRWPTPGVGTSLTYCGSAMTYVTASQSYTDVTQFDDNDDFHLTWWWIRGPSSGACTIDFQQDEGSTDGTGSPNPPFDVQFAVLEFSEVISSGDPFEGVNVASTTGTTGSISLSPSVGRIAIWSSVRDGNTTIGTVAPSVDFGTVDTNAALGTSYHHNAGHYDAVGAKTITLTWGSGISRNAGLSGFHLKPN